MARRVHGNFKSLLRRLPGSVAEEIEAQLHKTGRTLLARARARVPVRTGALKVGLSYKVLPKSLRLRVGIIGKPLNRKLYYGRFVQFGHRIGYKGNRLKRLEKITAKGNAAKLIRLRRRANIRKFGVRPRPFLFTMTRDELFQPYQKIWGRAIHRAASGKGV